MRHEAPDDCDRFVTAPPSAVRTSPCNTFRLERSRARHPARLGGTGTLIPNPAPLIQLSSGVAGLDEVLGGGIPEFTFGLIAGGPGTGKTTLAQQLLFANTSAARPGLYFGGSAQPSRRLLAQQQQFSFFDTERVNRSVHYVN